MYKHLFILHMLRIYSYDAMYIQCMSNVCANVTGMMYYIRNIYYVCTYIHIVYIICITYIYMIHTVNIHNTYISAYLLYIDMYMLCVCKEHIENI